MVFYKTKFRILKTRGLNDNSTKVSISYHFLGKGKVPRVSAVSLTAGVGCLLTLGMLQDMSNPSMALLLPEVSKTC